MAQTNNKQQQRTPDSDWIVSEVAGEVVNRQICRIPMYRYMHSLTVPPNVSSNRAFSRNAYLTHSLTHSLSSNKSSKMKVGKLETGNGEKKW